MKQLILQKLIKLLSKLSQDVRVMTNCIDVIEVSPVVGM